MVTARGIGLRCYLQLLNQDPTLIAPEVLRRGSERCYSGPAIFYDVHFALAGKCPDGSVRLVCLDHLGLLSAYTSVCRVSLVDSVSVSPAGYQFLYTGYTYTLAYAVRLLAPS